MLMFEIIIIILYLRDRLPGFMFETDVWDRLQK